MPKPEGLQFDWRCKQRLLQPEWMDQPAVGQGELAQAIVGLQRLNRLGFAAQLLASACDANRFSPANPPARILDVACGNGGELRALHHYYRRQPECVGADVNTEFIAQGELISSTGIRFVQADVIAPGALTKLGQFDLITCSLFLHHLAENQIITLLRNLKAQCRGRIVISDLHRSALAWFGIGIASRVVTRSPIVHCDALLSVQAGFTIPEFQALLFKAGLERAELNAKFPFRLLATWDEQKPQEH
ncbi:MAG: methyltransferase domain-containing protein [Sumerlaeia bacterium]